MNMEKRRNRAAILVSDTKNTKKRLLQETHFFFMVGSYSTIQKKLTQNESELNVRPRTI